MTGNLFSKNLTIKNPSWLSEELICSLPKRIQPLKEIAGYPLTAEADIVRLSLPPFFVSAPNPFLESFVVEDNNMANSPSFRQAPLTVDVTAGKNDPLYFAHYYSTKVPPDAIVPHIVHYTNPGDTVFDGFCGTGMTGVAAQLCKDSRRVGQYGKAGVRKAIISDLSPAATFIAAGTNAIGEIVKYLDEVEEIIKYIEIEWKELFVTNHVGWPRGTQQKSKRQNTEKIHSNNVGRIEYIVWSDVFLCSSCSYEIVYWDLVFKGPGEKVPQKAPCPKCGSQESISTLTRAWETRFDRELQEAVKQAKQVPVLINYRIGSKRFEKHPDQDDLVKIKKLTESPLPHSPPHHKMPAGFNTAQPAKSHGFTHVHHFFSQRNLLLLTEVWSKCNQQQNPLLRMAGLYVLTGAVQRVCRLNRYMPNHDRHVGPLSGTLYVAPLTAEIPAINYLHSRISDLRKCSHGPTGDGIAITTQSATDLRNIPNNSIDYIFTDPPFGGNLNYSELNSLVEMWLDVRTNIVPEAIVNDVQQKGMPEYQLLMAHSFAEFLRILKPGHWMTVEFHNSQNAVWAAIQEALTYAGFVVADVRTLDKQKGTTKQLSYGGAVKQDLIIAAYKPTEQLEKNFKILAGTDEGVWNFIKTHLASLPVFVSKGGKFEVMVERKDFLLYDRMVAFHVKRGVTIPLSSAEFYRGLSQRFSERDGMYFLPNQTAEYDKKRITVYGVEQLTLFVSDEESARLWLREQIRQKPQTFQELHPQFMKEIGGWSKTEKPLELSTLLEQNFLCYDGKGSVPEQIHAYLSTNWKELRNLPKDDPTLVAKARDRWYVPDPNKAGDLEKLRERALLKEFEEYKEVKKKLKVFRLEAVRAGFKKAWQERDYAVIVAVADKIPNNVLEEDPKLLMWYDQAVTRMGGE